MKKSVGENFLNKCDLLVKQAVKDTGINLNLSRPFNLTPQDLVSSQQERRWAASRLLSKYSKELNLPHTPQGGAVVQLNVLKSTLTITSIISQQELYLPQVAYLLDYQTKKWFSIKLDMSSRSYVEKIESTTFGDSLSFPISVVSYSLLEVSELSESEVAQAKQYFNSHWLLGQNPQYSEINAWIEGEFRRSMVSKDNQTDLDIRMNQSELWLQSLLKQKAA